MAKIQESGENYLETILILQKRNGSVRQIDVANELGYTKPSISNAMTILRQSGYITDDAEGLHLTKAGQALAESIYERHQIISAMLIQLGVDETIARTDACRIEHVISQETFEKLKEHAKNNR